MVTNITKEKNLYPEGKEREGN